MLIGCKSGKAYGIFTCKQRYDRGVADPRKTAETRAKKQTRSGYTSQAPALLISGINKANKIDKTNKTNKIDCSLGPINARCTSFSAGTHLVPMATKIGYLCRTGSSSSSNCGNSISRSRRRSRAQRMRQGILAQKQRQAAHAANNGTQSDSQA